MQVGFIGLGTMGARMAARLQRAGYRLRVHDLRRQAAEPHLAAGATWAESVRQVAEESELVFTSLPTPADVEQVALGEQGFLNAVCGPTAPISIFRPMLPRSCGVSTRRLPSVRCTCWTPR